MTDFDPTSPDSYRYWVTEHVRFADLDMLGHVNNKAFATYYESGRVDYMAARGLSDGMRVGMAMVRLELDYRHEIRFPNTLKIGVRLAKLGNSSLTLVCAIFDQEGRCVSTARSVAVRFNAETRSSQHFSPEERALLERDL